MNTSIYIADGSIQAVTGADTGKILKVSGYWRQAMKPGIVANGAIKEQDQLKEILADFCKKTGVDMKRIQLVLDSNMLMTKDMEVPVLGTKKLRQIIETEFSVREAGYQEMIYDYAVLEPRTKSGGGRILACAVEKSLVQQYVSLFSSIGGKLLNVDIGLSCAIRYCRRTPELKSGTYILSVADGRDLVSILFNQGVYSFSNRSSLFESRGTSAAAVEISRNLSSLVQFHVAQKAEAPITNAYLCGLEEDEKDFCAEMSESLNMEVGPLQNTLPVSCSAPAADGLSYGDCLYCFGDLIKDK